MKRNSWIVFCFVQLVSLLAACALQPEKAPTAAVKTPVEEQPLAQSAGAGSLLKYAQSYAAMPAEAQKREFAQVSAKRRTEYTRMQLALMAIMPASRYRDIARAQTILDEHLKAPDSKDEGLRSLAMLLKNLLADQQKQEDTMQQFAQKLKDEQQRTEMLQKKLDQLLAVEKTMNERRPAK
jgi:hypothetical protein